MLLSVSEALDAALSLLERPNGWTQGELRSLNYKARGRRIAGKVLGEGESYCAIGSLNLLVDEGLLSLHGHSRARSLLAAEAREVFPEYSGVRHRGVTSTNDHGQTTKAMIKRWFQATLVRLRAQEEEEKHQDGIDGCTRVESGQRGQVEDGMPR